MMSFSQKSLAIDFRSQSILFILIVIDLFTKHLALDHLMNQSVNLIPGWVSFHLAFNHGTAFSLLSQSDPIWHTLLTLLNALTIIGLTWW